MLVGVDNPFARHALFNAGPLIDHAGRFDDDAAYLRRPRPCPRRCRAGSRTGAVNGHDRHLHRQRRADELVAGALAVDSRGPASRMMLATSTRHWVCTVPADGRGRTLVAPPLDIGLEMETCGPGWSDSSRRLDSPVRRRCRALRRSGRASTARGRPLVRVVDLIEQEGGPSENWSKAARRTLRSRCGSRPGTGAQ